MATLKYDALVDKTRAWANKPDTNTISNEVIGDCLSYAADEAYRQLRIPPLEKTVHYTIASTDNQGENSLGLPFGNAYTSFDTPTDLTQFNFIRTVATEVPGGTAYALYPANVSKVFHEITDKRTFFDIYSEKYSRYNWMWMDGKVFIHPQLAVGTIVEINYYCRLPALNAVCSVVPTNYVIDTTDANQPYLEVGTVNDTALYFATKDSVEAVFATSAEAAAYGTTVTTKYYTGREAANWLRDENERVLLWGALGNLGGYLFDDKMEQRYITKFQEIILSLNKEEKWRRASGGNVQMNFNSGNLI